MISGCPSPGCEVAASAGGAQAGPCLWLLSRRAPPVARTLPDGFSHARGRRGITEAAHSLSAFFIPPSVTPMPLPSWPNGHRRAKTLTKLPPKLNLRSDRRASLGGEPTASLLSLAGHPASRQPAHFTVARSAVYHDEHEGVQHADEFESLLRRAPGEGGEDVRQSVRASFEFDDHQGTAKRPSLANCRSESNNHHHQDEAVFVLPGGDVGFTGQSRGMWSGILDSD